MSFKKAMKPVFKAGFLEKDVVLPDGTSIHYGEGPSNEKQPILLIHGQTGAWQDYSPVLPELAVIFHVFAVDCHGHGKSSKNAEKYKAKEIGKDLTWFIENVAGRPAVVSGHSSGGLIAAWLAANSPQAVSGALLEDPPFFSTIPGGRWEKSFAYIDTYETIHRFLSQNDETDWTLFYLKNAAWGKFLSEKAKNKMINYGTKYRNKHPGKPLNYFFLPDSLNRMFWFVDEYDLRFGDTFYDSTWFEDYDQEDVLSRIACPCVLIHTKWSINEEGILMAAMSGDDAARAASLIPNCELLTIDSGHNSHAEKPKAFLEAVYQLEQKL